MLRARSASSPMLPITSNAPNKVSIDDGGVAESLATHAVQRTRTRAGMATFAPSLHAAWHANGPTETDYGRERERESESNVTRKQPKGCSPSHPTSCQTIAQRLLWEPKSGQVGHSRANCRPILVKVWLISTYAKQMWGTCSEFRPKSANDGQMVPHVGTILARTGRCWSTLSRVDPIRPHSAPKCPNRLEFVEPRPKLGLRSNLCSCWTTSELTGIGAGNSLRDGWRASVR